MKLSQLKLYLKALEAKRIPGTDPTITFWVDRNQARRPPGDKDATTFIEMQLSLSDAIVDGENLLDRHMITADDNAVVQKSGDFSLPVYIVPFYK